MIIQIINIILLALLPITCLVCYKYKFYAPRSLNNITLDPPFDPTDILLTYFIAFFCAILAQTVLLSQPQFEILKNLSDPAKPQPTDQTRAIFNLINLLSFTLPSCCFILFKAHLNNKTKDPLGLSPWRLIKIPHAIPLTFIIAITITSTVNLVLTTTIKLINPEPLSEIAHKSLEFITQTQSIAALVITLINAIIIAPIAEEILYRGLIQNAFHRHFKNNPFIPIIAASSIFALIHWGTAPNSTQLIVTLPTLFALSCIMGYSYFKTNSLLVPIATHLLFNALNVALAFLQTPAP